MKECFRTELRDDLSNFCKHNIKNLSKVLVFGLIFVSLSCTSSFVNSEKESREDNVENINDEPVTEKQFKKNGISFSYPSNWFVSDEDEEAGTFYLSLEKKGEEESGLIVLNWDNNIIDYLENIKDMQEEYLSLNIAEDVLFEEIEEAQFNGIFSLFSRYSFSVMGMKHRGILTAFSSKDYMFSILEQEALEDVEKNINGFRMFKSTFKIEDE